MSNSNMSDSNGSHGWVVFVCVCLVGIMAGIFGDSPLLVIIGILLLIGIPACVFFFKLFKAFGEIDKEDDEE